MAGQAKVAVIMGSQSDWPTMQCAVQVLGELGVDYEARIVSAHRTPDRMVAFAREAEREGFAIIIAGAGGAAHLPGMVAAMTHLPVLGVPVQSKALSGQDSLLSIVQMPAGVPVGTLAIGEAGATNAGLMAAAILALSDEALSRRLQDWRQARSDAVAERPTQPLDTEPKARSTARQTKPNDFDFTVQGVFRRQPLRLVIEHNPKQPGSASAKRFEGYFTLRNDGTDTVGDALAAGLLSKDITYDAAKGYIVVGHDHLKPIE